MTRHLLIAWGLLNLAAGVWTGTESWLRGGSFSFAMLGFFPPHYGYTMYAVSILPILASRWLGCWAWAGLLASRNRASQAGALVGWAWAGGARRRALAGILVGLVVVVGLALKPNAKNDSNRVMIWKQALVAAAQHPEGMGQGGFYVGVGGYAITKAHSDVLQLLVERGFRVTGVVLALLGLLFYLLPAGTPEKAALACLLSQSIIDNRLHHPACAGLLLAVWVAAARAKPTGDVSL